MLRFIRGVICLLLLLTCHGLSQGKVPEWYSRLQVLKPLSSTRHDVERVYTDATVDRTIYNTDITVVFYRERNGWFRVSYDTGTCRPGNYRVAKDTLVRMLYIPYRKDRFSDFLFDRKQFTKTFDSHDSSDHYLHKSLGFEVVTINGLVRHVEIFPSKSSPAEECPLEHQAR